MKWELEKGRCIAPDHRRTGVCIATTDSPSERVETSVEFLRVALDNGNNENKGTVWTMSTRELKFRQGNCWTRAERRFMAPCNSPLST